MKWLVIFVVCSDPDLFAMLMVVKEQLVLCCGQVHLLVSGCWFCECLETRKLPEFLYHSKRKSGRCDAIMLFV